MKVTLTSAAKVSPIASLDFVPSIAPFIGVSSYALEIEHVFLPEGREKGEHDIYASFISLPVGHGGRTATGQRGLGIVWQGL